MYQNSIYGLLWMLNKRVKTFHPFNLAMSCSSPNQVGSTSKSWKTESHPIIVQTFVLFLHQQWWRCLVALTWGVVVVVLYDMNSTVQWFIAVKYPARPSHCCYTNISETFPSGCVISANRTISATHGEIVPSLNTTQEVRNSLAILPSIKKEGSIPI